MYQYIDGNCALSVNDWMAAGLTYSQFKHDSERGFLQIARRGINGETLIWVDSIRRADRLRVIELAYGKAKTTNTDIYAVVMDVAARQFYTGYHQPDGMPLDATHGTRQKRQTSGDERLVPSNAGLVHTTMHRPKQHRVRT